MFISWRVIGFHKPKIIRPAISGGRETLGRGRLTRHETRLAKLGFCKKDFPSKRDEVEETQVDEKWKDAMFFFFRKGLNKTLNNFKRLLFFLRSMVFDFQGNCTQLESYHDIRNKK